MIIVNSYTLKEDAIRNLTIIIVKFIMHCPCCNSPMYHYGTRCRKYIPENEQNKKTILIRRLKCTHCKRIHHELPSFLVPYKLHCQQTVENAIEATNTENFPNNCENSTVHKIKKWFSKRTKLFYLGLIKRRNTKPIPNEPKLDPEEKFFRMKGWLKKTVWDLINHGLWFATRSEFPFELA